MSATTSRNWKSISPVSATHSITSGQLSTLARNWSMGLRLALSACFSSRTFTWAVNPRPTASGWTSAT
ncbi:hypothetical protein FQZ97_1242630 [compost metagenome]